MSLLKKAGQFDLALSLLFECRDYIERSWSGTPNRNELLEKIRLFEELLTADFSQKGE